MWIIEQPGFMLLLVLVPAGVWLRHFWHGRGGRLSFSFAIWGGTGLQVKSHGTKVFLIFSALVFWSGVVLLIVAMAGPVIYFRERVYLSRGVDIMIVIDESPSMAALDFKPMSRFDSAKKVITSFINGRSHDPIGLVSFGKEAALRVPPTLDYDVLKERVAGLSLMELGDGTAIGMGIALAALHLRNSSADHKFIILLTDGENNAGEILPETATAVSSNLGIKIYTIGIGTEGDVPLEFVNPETGKLYRGVFKSGYDEDLLRNIAASSGGEYFSAMSHNSLESIFKTIDSLETRGQKVKIKTRTEPKHRVFLLLGMLFVTFDYFFRKIVLREVLP